MYQTVVSFFRDGGIFMYPIMLVLAFGLAIALERYIYLSSTRRKNRNLVKQLMPLVKNGDLQQAFKISAASKHAIAYILAQGLESMKSAKRRDDVEAAIGESMMEVLPQFEKRTHYLAMFANIATLLGLLGTIIGLIEAFTAVAQVDPAMKAEILSTSISVAMNTTAFGLIVAIPLLFIYTVLQTKTNQLVESLEVASVKFFNLLAKHLQ